MAARTRRLGRQSRSDLNDRRRHRHLLRRGCLLEHRRGHGYGSSRLVLPGDVAEQGPEGPVSGILERPLDRHFRDQVCWVAAQLECRIRLDDLVRLLLGHRWTLPLAPQRRDRRRPAGPDTRGNRFGQHCDRLSRGRRYCADSARDDVPDRGQASTTQHANYGPSTLPNSELRNSRADRRGRRAHKAAVYRSHLPGRRPSRIRRRTSPEPVILRSEPTGGPQHMRCDISPSARRSPWRRWSCRP